MNTQVSQSASKLVEWLQTTGAAYGLRIVAALVILLVGAIVIRYAAKALEKLLEKTRLGEKSLVAKFLVSVAVKVAFPWRPDMGRTVPQDNPSRPPGSE